jgi:hypothetical protein
MISRIAISATCLLIIITNVYALEKVDCSKVETYSDKVHFYEHHSILYVTGTEKQLSFKKNEKHEAPKLKLMFYKGLSDFIRTKYPYKAFNTEVSEVTFYTTSCDGKPVYVYSLPLKNLIVSKVDQSSDQKNIDNIDIKEINDPFEDFK